MKRLLAASALALSVVASFSAYAASDNYSFSNGVAMASGLAITSCQFVSPDVIVARAGTHNLNAPSTTGVALINIGVYDYCTGSFFFESAYTTNFQFSASGPTTGIPQSVTASGTVTANCYSPSCPSSTDTVTFSVAWDSVGASAREATTTSHITAPGVTTDEHRDETYVPARVTGTVSTVNLGTVQSNWSANLADAKTHTVSITH